MGSREIFWNIAHREWMYVLTLIALLLFSYGFFSHLKIWLKGYRTGDCRLLFQQLRSFLVQAFFQRRILRDRYSGLMHLLIFWGFFVLFLGTVLLAIDYDFLRPVLGLSFLHGSFYKIYSFVLDIFGGGAIVGSTMALFKRHFIRKNWKSDGYQEESALWLFVFVLFSGFVLESIRIIATSSSSEWWSPIGFSLAWLLPITAGGGGLIIWYTALWWTHLFLSLCLIALIPYTRLFHMISSSVSMLFGPLRSKGALAPVFSEPFNVKVKRITSFSRQQLIELDACTQCGRCEKICPVSGEVSEFSPMKIMGELKKSLWSSKNNLSGLSEAESLANIWNCLTCRACEEECPVFLKVIEKIVEIRRYRAMVTTSLPAEIKSVFRNIETFGDPWAMGGYFREDWILGEETRKRLRTGEGFLIWVGCQSAFHERSKGVARAFTKLLDDLKIDYFLLGKEEVCCGDLARRTGNEFLSRKLILRNMDILRKYGAQDIVTLCPHCFHMMKEEYPHWGAEFNVLHYTQLIAKLLEEGKLRISDSLNQVVTYHDPCYLGRYHHLFNEPRVILKQIPRSGFIEMNKNRLNSVCCGAGGGNIWLRGNVGGKINEARLQELQEKKVQIVCTSCPYCLVMLEEAIRNTKKADFKAMDLIELLESAQ